MKITWNSLQLAITHAHRLFFTNFKATSYDHSITLKKKIKKIFPKFSSSLVDLVGIHLGYVVSTLLSNTK
jgi:hypothetical protein